MHDYRSCFTIGSINSPQHPEITSLVLYYIGIILDAIYSTDWFTETRVMMFTTIYTKMINDHLLLNKR